MEQVIQYYCDNIMCTETKIILSVQRFIAVE